MLKSLRIFPLVSILLLAACTGRQQQPLKERMESLAAKHDVVGMSLTVVKHGKIVYSEGFGLRDIGRELPVRPDTRFRVASISKFITAAAVLQLFEAGRFDLDDDVSESLGFHLRNPEYPDEVISYRSLLSHTSSLRDGEAYNLFLDASYSNTPPESIQALLMPGGQYFNDEVFDQKHGPDENWFQYGNINFGILASLVEIHSGQRFDEYCREHLFEPLNIGCSFNIQHLSDIDNLSVLYRKPDGRWTAQKDDYSGKMPPAMELNHYRLGSNGMIFAPQGGLRASTEDLSVWAMMVMQGGAFKGKRVLQSCTIDTMLATVWTDTGGNGDNLGGFFENYALSCHRSSRLIPGSVVTGHAGLAYGLVSDLYFDTEKGISIAFVCNGAQYENGDSGWTTVEESAIRAAYRWAEEQP